MSFPATLNWASESDNTITPFLIKSSIPITIASNANMLFLAMVAVSLITAVKNRKPAKM